MKLDECLQSLWIVVYRCVQYRLRGCLEWRPSTYLLVEEPKVISFKDINKSKTGPDQEKSYEDCNIPLKKPTYCEY